ncbi:hypothetical protein GGS20DRAFT_577117 [Poronia punctata]|nr:hypothetical protein GGS20DRAFT_577117 [Poronia punctata]
MPSNIRSNVFQSPVQEILHVSFRTTEPLQCLNGYRKGLGLGPSPNLISSQAFQPPNRIIRRECAHVITPNHLPNRTRKTSSAYQGDPNLPRNVCAAIPDELNCRLWITGLPPTCTIRQLLSSIKGIGPVYACHVNEPIATGPKKFDTAAASLTFFTAEAATRFLERHEVKPFEVEGYVTTMTRHRIRTEPVPVNGRSRVLLIVGDPRVVTVENLSRIFTEEWNIRFDTEFVHFRRGQDQNQIHWAFGSFRAQAQAIHANINRHQLGNGVQAMYRADPCL